MTPEQLADQLTTPLLRNLTGRGADLRHHGGLSTGEVALLRMAEALHSVQALAPAPTRPSRRPLLTAAAASPTTSKGSPMTTPPRSTVRCHPSRGRPIPPPSTGTWPVTRTAVAAWPWVAAACAAVAVLSGVVGFAASRAMVDETRVDLMERWDGLDAEGKATMCDGFNDLGMDAMTDTAMEAFADDDELSEIPRSKSTLGSEQSRTSDADPLAAQDSRR